MYSCLWNSRKLSDIQQHSISPCVKMTINSTSCSGVESTKISFNCCRNQQRSYSRCSVYFPWYVYQVSAHFTTIVSLYIEFASIIKGVQCQYIPLKKCNRHKKVPWMSYKAMKLVERKHRIFKKYKSTTHPAYRKAAREAQSEMRRAKRSFEKKLAKNIDADRKSFYAYVRNRCRSKPSIGPLINNHDETISQLNEMAEVFNQFFASVFSARQHAERAICYRPSVRPSVCPSHWWISWKRLKLASCNFHRTVAPSL